MCFHTMTIPLFFDSYLIFFLHHLLCLSSFPFSPIRLLLPYVFVTHHLKIVLWFFDFPKSTMINMQWKNKI